MYRIRVIPSSFWCPTYEIIRFHKFSLKAMNKRHIQHAESDAQPRITDEGRLPVLSVRNLCSFLRRPPEGFHGPCGVLLVMSKKRTNLTVTNELRRRSSNCQCPSLIHLQFSSVLLSSPALSRCPHSYFSCPLVLHFSRLSMSGSGRAQGGVSIPAFHPCQTFISEIKPTLPCSCVHSSSKLEILYLSACMAIA